MSMLETALRAAAKRGRRRRRGIVFISPTTVLAGLGLGAGAMYLLDPNGGPRRRALVRDKATHAAKRAGDLLGKSSRELAHRSRGLVHDAQTRLRHETVPDYVLIERVRAAMGHATSHPGPVEVRASNGVVTLFGPVLAGEHRQVVEAIRNVPGVEHLDDRLEIHVRNDIPSLQGAPSRRLRAREQWSPLQRVSMDVLGGGLALYGVLRRDLVGTALALAGGAFVARSMANRPLRRIVETRRLPA